MHKLRASSSYDLLSGVNCWGRNCVRRARRKGGNHLVSGIQKRGIHTLPAPDTYTSEYNQYCIKGHQFFAFIATSLKTFLASISSW